MSLTLTVEHIEDPEFWREFNPEFSIEAERPAPRFAVSDPDGLLETIRTEGYVRVPGVVPEESFQSVRRCIERLHEAGIPLAFAFVYDELWELFQSVSGYVETLLGGEYWLLPAFWAWYVPPSDDAAGWRPHRDRGNLAVDDDNTPESLTVWLAFSEATTLNGCIHVLPLHADDRFTYRVFAGEGRDMVFQPQNIRALPAPAGSLMAWNQNLLHWGGRASRLATNPRCSAAMEFQRADIPPVQVPAIEPNSALTLDERLALIAKQILQYEHMYPLAPDIAATAASLWERFIASVKEQLAQEGDGDTSG